LLLPFVDAKQSPSTKHPLPTTSKRAKELACSK
jgi:hypothetical protein